MTARECLAQARAAGPHYQRFVNAFVDEFRRATPAGRTSMIADPIEQSGPLEGLVAAVVNAGRPGRPLPTGWGAGREPRAVLRVPGDLVRDARAPDVRVAGALPDPQRLRPRELPFAGVMARLAPTVQRMDAAGASPSRR
jgi:hypothetical protein